MASFKRVFRFEDPDEETHYADHTPGSTSILDLIGQTIQTRPAPFGNTQDTKRAWPTRKVAKILSPIPKAAHIYGIGLNYKGHAAEAKLPIPEYPMVFSKPLDALAGPFEDIPVDKECKFMDYEGELCVIIGRDCKNISESEDPMDYVLGYTVGNDVSSRYWQMPERAGQAGYAKGFDKFAPIGPVLVSPQELPDIGSKTMTTWVNGEKRQMTKLDDLIFNVPTLVRHLSRAMTLRQFTVILTGTPSGVGALMDPPSWLNHNDVVTVEIESIGMIKNKMVFME